MALRSEQQGERERGRLRLNLQGGNGNLGFSEDVAFFVEVLKLEFRAQRVFGMMLLCGVEWNCYTLKGGWPEVKTN